ncbi:hypothetical protein K435DRAFT_774232 [Dendrothele bispora CBS 962.96]|uniref:Uncharacterized protein n=1 Tax=Dendrothele bispora (strain CBS 962.96) TaxID=1314807 RepID=A0A4S8MPN1_DENBC|nr:hypothetical protein K435DRAFT_774232 [Dendrothele bispora CBS 962.96]
MLCATCSSEIPLPPHPLRSKEDILQNLREGILSPSDIPDIRKNISDAQDILKAYDKKIRQLERTLVAFRSMAGNLRERIQETSFLLSPIRRLPDEILAEVFEMSMPFGSVFSCTKQPAPSFLAVCARWRTVALSTPSIWRSIKLDYSGRSKHAHRNITALDHHLSNLSKSSPLDIHISDLDLRPLRSDCTEIAGTHFNSIAEQSSRWVTLTLDSHSGSLTAQIKRFNMIENFPSLRSLQLPGVVPSSTISSILKRSPVLTHLAIHLLPDEGGPFGALSNITHLELECFRDPTVFNVLDKCPKLISVMFELLHRDDLSAEEIAALCSHPPRHIPSIKAITIEVQDVGDETDYYLLPSLLSSLHLPSLVSITLSTFFFGPFLRRGALEAFRCFFKRSCAVTSLTLSKLDRISDEDTISLLELVPALTKLTIYEPISRSDGLPHYITCRFLQRLSSYDLDRTARTTLTARRLLLPKLEHLSLTVLGKTFLAEDQELVKLFVNVILSRWFPRRDLEQDYGVESLKYVKLHVVNGSVDRDIWDQLKCLDEMVAILEDSEGPCK